MTDQRAKALGLIMSILLNPENSCILYDELSLATSFFSNIFQVGEISLPSSNLYLVSLHFEQGVYHYSVWQRGFIAGVVPIITPESNYLGCSDLNHVNI